MTLGQGRPIQKLNICLPSPWSFYKSTLLCMYRHQLSTNSASSCAASIFQHSFSLKHLIRHLETLYQNFFLHLALHFSLHVNFLLFLEFSLPWFPPLIHVASDLLTRQTNHPFFLPQPWWYQLLSFSAIWTATLSTLPATENTKIHKIISSP